MTESAVCHNMVRNSCRSNAVDVRSYKARNWNAHIVCSLEALVAACELAAEQEGIDQDECHYYQVRTNLITRTRRVRRWLCPDSFYNAVIFQMHQCIKLRHLRQVAYYGGDVPFRILQFAGVDLRRVAALCRCMLEQEHQSFLCNRKIDEPRVDSHICHRHAMSKRLITCRPQHSFL